MRKFTRKIFMKTESSKSSDDRCTLVCLAVVFAVVMFICNYIKPMDTESIIIPANTTKKVQIERVNINPNPMFETGSSSGNLEITNDKHNRYTEQVEIYTKDTNKLIYKGTVEVGQKIETDTLLVDLPADTYSCTAYFRAINPETGEGVRKESADIMITIQD